MSEKHYNIEEALETEGGVFNQTYDLTIVTVGETKELSKRDGSGKFKIQALQVTDGTAEIKYSIFDPDRIFKEGMGIHAEGAYIKEKDGYTELKVKRGSKVEYSDTSKIQPQKEFLSSGDMGSTNDILKSILEVVESVQKTLTTMALIAKREKK